MQLSLRKKRLSISSVVIAFVLALVIGTTSGAGTTYAAESSLSVLKDGVLISHDGGPFVSAIDGEPVHEGDIVRTGDGRAVVTYFEGSTVTIEPDSELAIVATKVASDGGTIVLMTQLFGRTWNVVTKLITGGSRYEIRTPSTTASVRGTEFEVDVDRSSTTVSTTEGLVLQRVPQSGRTVDVPVPAGMTQTQRLDAPPAPATPRSSAKKTVRVALPRTGGLVLDEFGRANGIRRDGRVVALTPGARVGRSGGSVVVTLPDIDGADLTVRADDDRGPVHLAARAGSHRSLTESGATDTIATGDRSGDDDETHDAPDPLSPRERIREVARP